MAYFNLTYDAQGDPLIEDCLKVPFFRYYGSPEVNSAFRAVYKEEDIREKYFKFQQAVADHFADMPSIIGYDPLNEGGATPIEDGLIYIEHERFDRDYFQPFYKKMGEAYGDKLMFFEPS